jgi:IS5 family transposase
MAPQDTRRVIVDTTVQPKNVMFPTDAKLLHRAREKLVALAQKVGLDLRQSYMRVGKFALIRHQRYAHAKQFKRANKALRTLRTYLGRTIRDIARQIAGEDDLQDIFREAPASGEPGSGAAAKPARQEGLQPACSRGRVHRQGQGACALRVRRKSLDCHHAAPLEGRSVCPSCQSTPRQSL